VLSVLTRYSLGGKQQRYNYFHMRAAVSAPQPTVAAIVPTENSPLQCYVDCREVEIGPAVTVEVAEAEGEEKGQEAGDSEASDSGWEVKRVGPRFSGRLVLNMADNRHLLTAPTPPPTQPQSAKQRYLATFGCSVRHPANSSTRPTACHVLLPPQPPLPAPTVPPRWFSEHLRDAVANGAEAPPIPVSPYPPLAVWPVCRTCRAEAASAIQAICDQWRRWRRERPLQVDCIVRVNENEWDIRQREYEDECEYRRVALTTNHQPHPTSSTSPPAPPPALSLPLPPATAHGSSFTATRLYQHDSGQYAISHPSNLPFNNPAPPSGPPRSHPQHEHLLRYYRVSPYRHGGYVCNICAANANGEVWHCEKCQFDLCMECAAEWPVPEGEEGKDEAKEGREEAEEEEAELAMDAGADANADAGVADEDDEPEQDESDEWMSDATEPIDAATL